ncbi:MAG TPA: cytochrome c3 family protein [Polyangiaceae bacterium LLY-WYZ-14_1]|nr:cytochrome c3 family protein [Polyangiaceae bacterium LLY-WYZ-14_1]
MQTFPKTLNLLPLVVAVAAVVGGAGLVFSLWYWASPKSTQVGYAPRQPVPYSHRLHAGQLGMDCRYCHAQVERSAHAMIPPTQTCMGCHAVVKQGSPQLQPVYDSWETGDPIEWVRVHKVPDHAYFNHSVHLSAGVGCENCHGRIDQAEVVRVEAPLSMGWCIECHRNPESSLRPVSEITTMGWEPDPSWDAAAAAAAVNPPQHCSACHR